MSTEAANDDLICAWMPIYTYSGAKKQNKNKTLYISK